MTSSDHCSRGEQKEEVHREATRLTAMQHRDGVTPPYGARKVALDMGPGEKNKVQGFRELIGIIPFEPFLTRRLCL
jgi:hypothetical protein